MQAQIIGISGSPIKNSNTDRLVQSVLESSGLTSEFVKLSKINVRPCIACLGCKKDNICKPKDDFQELAEKIRHAGAVVVGGYSPYGVVDGFTKAFLERLFSLRHQKRSEPGKTCRGCHHRDRTRCPRFGGGEQPDFPCADSRRHGSVGPAESDRQSRVHGLWIRPNMPNECLTLDFWRRH